MKKSSNAYKIVTVAAFALILVTLTVLTFVFLPSDPSPFSENENRYLKQFPNVTFENYKNEKLMKGIEDWFADRFFGREEWIKLRNGTERLIGKTEVNGIFTADDRMIEFWKGYDSGFVDSNLSAMEKFAKKYSDVPTYFLLAPTSQEIYSDLFPYCAPIGSQSALIEYCRDNLPDIQMINIVPTMMQHKDDYIYYRTDHHWTSFGAYLAYYDAAKVMGFKPFELGEYNIEHAASDFRGTLYSKTLDDTVTPDIMDYYHLKGEQPVRLTVNTGKEVNRYDSLYFREYLEVKDKYSSFTGPNSPYMNIETGIDGPSLLIFKDSYAHSLIPFLTAHFSKITVLDLRYMNDGFSRYVKVNDYDSVLFLYNAITFTEAKDVRKLNMG